MSNVFIIAEIGINHNGDINIAKQMIDKAVKTGFNAVKFQKRTVDKVYTPEFLDSYRESPWGTTQRAQKEGLEFGFEAYSEIDRYCKSLGIEWFASSWDVDAQIFLRQFDLKYNKVASAMLTNIPLLETIAEEKRYTFIATGMSEWQEIDQAVEIFTKANCPFELMHCVSVYPMPPELANLKMIGKLRERYNCKVGFSSHESGNIATLGAVALGASSIERHVTLDRTMYGSDQKSSVELAELEGFIRDIRQMELTVGTGERVLSEPEKQTRSKLRG